MSRWTVRGVTPEAVKAVQQAQDETGATLGEIVSACIEAGLATAREQLVQSRYPTHHHAEVTALQQAIQRAIAALESRTI